MLVTAHADPKAFAELATPFLMRDEATNCLCLGIIDTLLTDPARYSKYYLLSVGDSSSVLGIAWMTPPHPLGLSPMPAAASEALVQYALTLEDGVPSVVGPKPAVDAFKDLWLARRSCGLESTLEQRIYRLERVTPPRRVPGELRPVTDADRDVLNEWSFAFARDCGLKDDRESVRAGVSAALRNRSRVFWELDGKPVSMAGYGGKTPSGIRISWVYTPPEQRRRGYASALVAALSQRLLTRGHQFCFLYTDLANPTSNSIYQRIGYRPAADSAHYTFGNAR